MSQKQYLLPYVGGKFIQVKQKGERSALEHIQKKIEYFLPIETVDVEEMRKVINYIRVNVNRDCTAEEVNGLVQSIKNLLNDALDNMPKHERYLSERGNHDKEGS